MRLPAHVHQVRWGAHPGRVLAPAQRLTGTTVESGVLTGSRADLLRLGAWIRVAAISPHSIVYLPSRPMGLVIARSDTGLRPSAWKAVRARLRHARPGLIRAPRHRTPNMQSWATPRIRLVEHASTLVLIGPPQALFDLGDAITEAGHAVATARDIHRHGRAYLLGLAGTFADDRDGPVEFDIIGNDPLFHKRARATRLRSLRRGAGPAARSGRGIRVPRRCTVAFAREHHRR